MFDSLTDKFNEAFSGLRGKGKLTDDDIDQAMRAIRMSLLEADVNLLVVKKLTKAIKERATGDEVKGSLTPDQQVVKIVSDELTELMGKENTRLPVASTPPTIVLMAGLQGSGKTTCTAKLAKHLYSQGRAPLMVACDVHRPAAADQLEVLGAQISVPVYRGDGKNAVAIATEGITHGRETARDVIIVDTAGRLTIDEEMMGEIAEIREAIQPTSTILVVDAMTGQTAVEVAEAFSQAVDVTGVVLSKLDGDARGGAALSIRAITDLPILFIGTGEKVDALEPFHPERVAQRILGMGDVLSLIEKAQETVDIGDAQEMEERLRGGSLTLEDFSKQMQQIRKMGPLSGLLGMLPGIGKQIKSADIDESRLDRIEAIISSMTPEERRKPDMISGSRRRRIAAGSGTSVQEINQLLSQFKQMKKVMKQMGKGGRGMPSLPGMS